MLHSAIFGAETSLYSKITHPDHYFWAGRAVNRNPTLIDCATHAHGSGFAQEEYCAYLRTGVPTPVSAATRIRFERILIAGRDPLVSRLYDSLKQLVTLFGPERSLQYFDALWKTSGVVLAEHGELVNGFPFHGDEVLADVMHLRLRQAFGRQFSGDNDPSIVRLWIFCWTLRVVFNKLYPIREETGYKAFCRKRERPC